MIYLRQTWVNDEGVIIHSKLPAELDEEGNAPPPVFFAVAQGTAPVGGQIIPVQFQFDIPGATITDAFANYPAALEEAKAAVLKKAGEEHRKALLMNGVARLPGYGGPRGK